MYLGYLAGYWTDPGEASRRDNDPTGAGGFGRFGDLAASYAAATGLDLSELAHYRRSARGAWPSSPRGCTRGTSPA